VGKILRKNYQPSYTLGATWYPAMPILSKKKSGIPLGLFISEMILKVKMAFYERNTNNNCRN